MKVLGARGRALRRAVGEVINRDNIEWFLSLAKSDGADPLGENGSITLSSLTPHFTGRRLGLLTLGGSQWTAAT
jgi:hypothetical protein